MSHRLLVAVSRFVLQLMCVGGVFLFSIPPVLAQSTEKNAGAATAISSGLAKVPPISVASIKLNKANGGWRLGFTWNGYSAMGVTIRQIVEDAYGIYEKDRILNTPAWMSELKYDLVAKVDDENAELFRSLPLEQRQVALQALLAERVHLHVHKEERERSIYNLVIGKGGFKLAETKPGSDPVHGDQSVVTRGRNGALGVHWFTMSEFASLLSLNLSRHVVDKTGLTGRYDFYLEWDPDSERGTATEVTTPTVPTAPSFFTALREQLGLELKVEKASVQVLIIDHAEKPTEN